jgi:hypothetical protein
MPEIQISPAAVEAAEARLIGDNPPGTKAWHDQTRLEIRVTLQAAAPFILAPVEAQLDEMREDYDSTGVQLLAERQRADQLQKQLEEALEALTELGRPARWDHNDTGRVTWLHLDGKTKPWEIAHEALALLDTQDSGGPSVSKEALDWASATMPRDDQDSGEGL